MEANQNQADSANNTEAGQQKSTESNIAETLFTDGKENQGEQQQQQSDGKTDEKAGDDAGKTEGAKKDDEAGEKKEAAKKEGAPEKYEFKVADGQEADPEVIGELETLAREFNLSQENAQKLADLGGKVAQKVQDKFLATIQTANAEWEEQAAKDPEFGGDKLDENLSVAKKALDAFGTPELKSLLGKYDKEKNPKGTGLGSHPELIRAFFRAGKQISEGKFVTGSPAKGSASTENILYDKSSTKKTA